MNSHAEERTGTYYCAVVPYVTRPISITAIDLVLTLQTFINALCQSSCHDDVAFLFHVKDMVRVTICMARMSITNSKCG